MIDTDEMDVGMYLTVHLLGLTGWWSLYIHVDVEVVVLPASGNRSKHDLEAHESQVAFEGTLSLFAWQICVLGGCKMAWP